MNVSNTLFLLACMFAGLVVGYVCFRLNILHDRAGRMLFDQPPPPKGRQFFYFFCGAAVLIASIVPLAITSKSVASPIQFAGLALWIVTWFGFQIALTIKFKRSLERAGKDSRDGRNVH
jgi:hypothetical protein